MASSGLVIQRKGSQNMGIDINSFSRKYELAYETFETRDGRIRLAIANGQPASKDSQEYNSITGNPLLCLLNSSEWALVTSKGTTLFEADGGADAVDHAKRILVDSE